MSLQESRVGGRPNRQHGDNWTSVMLISAVRIPTCHHSALFDSDALSPRTVEYQPPDSIARDPPHLHSTLHLFRFELIPNQILG